MNIHTYIQKAFFLCMVQSEERRTAKASEILFASSRYPLRGGQNGGEGGGRPKKEEATRTRES